MLMTAPAEPPLRAILSALMPKSFALWRRNWTARAASCIGTGAEDVLAVDEAVIRRDDRVTHFQIGRRIEIGLVAADEASSVEVDQNGRRIVGRGTFGEPEIEGTFRLCGPYLTLGRVGSGRFAVGLTRRPRCFCRCSRSLRNFGRNSRASFMERTPSLSVSACGNRSSSILRRSSIWEEGGRGVGPVLGGDGGGDME